MNRPVRQRHAMTVDVEDYFQVYAFFKCIPRDSWDGYSCRVEANVERILAQFATAGIYATFFTLGWIAERHPAMIRRIVDAGHELASHGYDHRRVDAMDPAAFREDLRRTRAILQDASGVAVRGYRAPTFSIGPTTPWAFDILAEEGLVGLTVSPHLGGGGAGWAESLRVLGAVARGEPSTALILFMTYGYHAQPTRAQSWPTHIYETLARQAVAGGGLIGGLRV